MKEKAQSGHKAKLERKTSKRLVCLLTVATTDKYMVCTFEEKESTKYGIIVLDKNGKEVFKTPDKAYI